MLVTNELSHLNFLKNNFYYSSQLISFSPFYLMFRHYHYFLAYSFVQILKSLSFLFHFISLIRINLQLNFPLRPLGFPDVKNPPVTQESQETRVQSLGEEESLEEGMATHSRILAWRSPVESASMGSQRVGHS